MHTEALEVNHFWQEYRTAVLRQGVPQVRAEWFVRWAQRFARSGKAGDGQWAASSGRSWAS
jgi:hypothetical protein